jgi:hypothetical protein
LIAYIPTAVYCHFCQPASQRRTAAIGTKPSLKGCFLVSVFGQKSGISDG